MKKSEIGYIAGLLDGEGSIYFTVQTTTNIRACICVVANSNPLIIARAEEILQSWGVPFATRETHLHFWHIDLKGSISDKKCFLKLIIPYLAGKKEQAKLMLAFLKRRGGTKRQVLLSDNDKSLVSRVKYLNHVNKLGSVETVRESPEKVKIQSELTGDSKRVAEMPTPIRQVA